MSGREQVASYKESIYKARAAMAWTIYHDASRGC